MQSTIEWAVKLIMSIVFPFKPSQRSHVFRQKRISHVATHGCMFYCEFISYSSSRVFFVQTMLKFCFIYMHLFRQKEWVGPEFFLVINDDWNFILIIATT